MIIYAVEFESGGPVFKPTKTEAIKFARENSSATRVLAVDVGKPTRDLICRLAGYEGGFSRSEHVVWQRLGFHG